MLIIPFGVVASLSTPAHLVPGAWSGDGDKAVTRLQEWSTALTKVVATRNGSSVRGVLSSGGVAGG
eukprot:739257-Prymnesium_polylepis.1